MRRLALFGFVGVAVAGCDMQSGNFDYDSTLYQRTDGVALKGYDAMYGGNRAQVGMNTMTCEVDQSTAMLGNDYDYATDSDHVTDAGLMGDAMTVLVTTGDMLHVQYNDGWVTGAEPISVPGIHDALVSTGGPVVLADDGTGCAVKWVGSSSDSSRSIGGSCSAYGFAVDPATGHAYVGSDSGVTHVTPNGSEVITEQATQIVAWDAAAEVLYAAEYGSMVVRGLEADGSERFVTDVGASILSIDDLGTRGAALLSVSHVDGTGGVIVVDGLTGAIETSQSTPSAVEQIVGSPDGGSMALVDTDQVHFYRVGTLASVLGAEGEQDLDPILGF
jgi:hypothetical protein